MCEAVKNSISVLSLNGLQDEIKGFSSLSDGFYDYEGKRVRDLRTAISQLGELLSVENGT